MDTTTENEKAGQTMPCIQVTPQPGDAGIIPHSESFAATLSRCRCEQCALATADQIPDPATPWEAGMRAKPRINGFRCHLVKPSHAGLPAVTADCWCAYFTDTDGKQPLRHLASERSAEQ